MSGNGIVAAGNFIVDNVKVIDVFPTQDTLANIFWEQRCNGGSAFNLLTDLARLKAPFPLSALGLVGNDEPGEWIRSSCCEQGIDVQRLSTVEAIPTSYTDVMSVQETGRRTFFHQRGANASLDLDRLDFVNCTEKILHLGYLLLLDSLDMPSNDGTVAATALRRATECGLKTSIDVVSEDSNRFQSTVLPALPFTDYCFMNEVEAGRTTGVNCSPGGRLDWIAVEVAAQKLVDAGVREWAFIHAPEGCLAMPRTGDAIRIGSVQLPADRIAGSVGAGDAFAAGVLFGLHEGKGIDDCLRYGTCAAAACLLDFTTSDGIGSLDDCLALGERYGFRPFS